MSSAKKQRKPSEHPSYKDMITAALIAEKAPKGVSKSKIFQYICRNYQVGPNSGNQLRLSLRRLLTSGYVVNTKGIGCSGSFKLGEKTISEQKKKAALNKKQQKLASKPKKQAPKKRAAPKKKTAVSKVAKKPAQKVQKKPVAKKAKSSPKKKVVKKSPQKSARPAAKRTTQKKSKTPQKKAAPKKKPAKKTQKRRSGSRK